MFLIDFSAGGCGDLLHSVDQGSFLVERECSVEHFLPQILSLFIVHGVEDLADQGQLQVFDDLKRLLSIVLQTFQLPDGDVKLRVQAVLQLAYFLRQI